MLFVEETKLGLEFAKIWARGNIIIEKSTVD